MPIAIKMPALSPTMEEGTLAKWLVKAGDSVKSGDVLAEIETDKAVMEFEAVDEGVIATIDVAEGSEGVKVGTVIATLTGEDEDEAPAAKAPPVEAKPSAAEEERAAPEPAARAPIASPPPKAQDEPASPVPRPGEGDRILASPLARRIAAAGGVDLSSIKGSGPGGRIVKADLADGTPSAGATAPSEPDARHAGPRPVPSRPDAPAADPSEIPHETVKLSSMRKVIAKRLTEAKQTVPHYYLTIDCRLDALLDLRAELNAALKPRGIKLSVNDLLVKALGHALVEVPEANVRFAGDSLLKFSRVDIAMAVAVPGGLVTPVITDVTAKPLSRIAADSQDLAARARDGKLRPDEYQGGTASISNLGMYGIAQFAAVINPPQGMIMAVGAGQRRPWVVDDALTVATVLSATGSFDHRAIDGAVGAELMAAFKRLVEAPVGMLA